MLTWKHKTVARIIAQSRRGPLFLLFIGAGGFVVGMAIHNEATAKSPAPPPEPIYYCATGEEIPLYEPCKDRKDQQDI